MSDSVQISESNLAKKPINVGLIYALLLLVLFANGFSLFKMIPIVGNLMETFSVETGKIGILNSANTWATMIFAIPLGYFIRNNKPRLVLATGGLVLLIGHAIPILLQGSFWFLVAGRAIEGIGSACVSMGAMSLTMTLFMGRKGASTAISATIAAPMVAQFVHLNVAGRVVVNYGWQGVYTYIAAIQVVVILIFVIACGSHITIVGTAKAEKPDKTQTARVYKNYNLWCIAIGMGLFALATVQFGTYVPTYFQSIGMGQNEANGLYSVSTLLGLLAMVGSGALADRLKTKRKIAIVSFLGGVVAFILLMTLPASAMIIYILVYGTIPRAVNPMTQAAVPNLVESKIDVPIAKSLMDWVGQIFSLFSAVVVGYLIQLGGWHVTMTVLAILMAIGALLWAVAKKIP